MMTDVLASRLPPSVHLCGRMFDSDAVPRWTDWLSPEERACRAGFGSETRRHEFLAGRAAARTVLAAVLDVAPPEVPLARANDGAVDVVGHDWHVSIAHSGTHAVAVCARHAVGVDLEQIQPRDPALRRFLFAPHLRAVPDALPYDANTALLLCWTLKEAVLKARRSGFRTSPKDLRLDVDARAHTATVQVTGGDAWTVLFERLDDFWCAVALPRSGSRGGRGEGKRAPQAS